MIIDLKTHIYSLVAVFLALGIGILLGTGLGSVLNQEQKNIITRLESDFNRYLEEKKALQSTIQQKNRELEMEKQFDRYILSYLIQDHLLGRKIAIIRTSDEFKSHLIKEITSTLEMAGAKVKSVTQFLPLIVTATPEQRTELAQAFQVSQPEALTQEVMKKVCEEIILGVNQEKLNFLQERDYIHLWGSYNQAVDTVIILGGASEEAKNFVTKIDLPLINALKKYKISIIAGETMQTNVSYIPQYRKKSIVTIDNLDTIPGQVAMVYSLSKGIRHGNYGVKDTARSLLPEL